MTAALNDEIGAAYESGRSSRDTADVDAYRLGKADGMMAVQSRFDRRDELEIDDPPELRSVH